MKKTANAICWIGTAAYVTYPIFAKDFDSQKTPDSPPLSSVVTAVSSGPTGPTGGDTGAIVGVWDTVLDTPVEVCRYHGPVAPKTKSPRDA